ncbi:uncharacterized protein LOC127250548 [Andrographis paniculata]|uniref:uncharacterized protein LOC127250548 n=1 Tax=Andrographis paniculata TaxID=175694 RepID=UPI0021E77D9A|nr:uncharacterized protein LOC127250548 [Andrographis paniculata]XP_051129838.1 uncharacterized protein LOC127250548 [Andrographis paniculata]XP_051129839.1 uncharacterized protein LOC127250548 [Andrographis paniculata]
MGSIVEIDSISIDINCAIEDNALQEHDHFSIREYVAEMRDKNRKICMPFGTQDVMIERANMENNAVANPHLNDSKEMPSHDTQETYDGDRSRCKEEHKTTYVGGDNGDCVVQAIPLQITEMDQMAEVENPFVREPHNASSGSDGRDVNATYRQRRKLRSLVDIMDRKNLNSPEEKSSKNDRGKNKNVVEEDRVLTEQHNSMLGEEVEPNFASFLSRQKIDGVSNLPKTSMSESRTSCSEDHHIQEVELDLSLNSYIGVTKKSSKRVLSGKHREIPDLNESFTENVLEMSDVPDNNAESGGDADDIPMDIVELMARNQWERAYGNSNQQTFGNLNGPSNLQLFSDHMYKGRNYVISSKVDGKRPLWNPSIIDDRKLGSSSKPDSSSSKNITYKTPPPKCFLENHLSPCSYHPTKPFFSGLLFSQNSQSAGIGVAKLIDNVSRLQDGAPPGASSDAELGACALNSNPAEFSAPEEGNEFTISYRDLIRRTNKAPKKRTHRVNENESNTQRARK